MSANFITNLNDTTAVVMEENMYDSLFKQYERVILESLITSFGLDMLIKDTHGGDVDTIHNVRQIGRDEKMTYKNENNRRDYENRGEYRTADYHSDSRFASVKSKARQEYNEHGTKLKDAYTGADLEYTKASAVTSDKRPELDHVVECKAIHDDRGRVLAGLSGVDLANNMDNFAWTNKSLNASMGSWARHKNEQYREKYGCDAPLDVVGMDAYLAEHPEIDADTQERMRRQYKKSLKAYEAQVAKAYYTSRKFYKDSAVAAGKLGLKMGLRATVGLIFAELWFAAKEEIDKVENSCEELFKAIGRGIKKGYQNALSKYKELIAKFCDGLIAGILSSLVTTLANIFFTTAKRLVRIIRQTWASLVEATRILLFNPDCLRFGERVRAASKVIATGASVVAGTMINELIAETPFGQLPFVGEIAATFCGTLVSGIMTCSLLFLLDRNESINKIVAKLNSLPTIENMVAYAREQSERLDALAAKVYELDIASFKKETALYNEALQSIDEHLDDVALLTALHSAYSHLTLDFPWGNHESFDTFMNNKNLTIKYC